jgi:carbonic anhydrase
MPRFIPTLFLMFSLTIFVGDSFSQEPAAPTADAALKLLKDGNDRFAQDKLAPRNLGAERRALLAKGQKPFAVVLACADSRVAPELIFDQGLGDIFVLRVAGNLTDPLILGSIEFAVGQMNTPLIVVLGHEKCGAVDAALTKKAFPGNLGTLVKDVHVGKDLPKENAEALPIAIKNNVVFQLSQMTARSELLKEEAKSKKVKIVGGVYRLGSGKVEWVEGK